MSLAAAVATSVNIYHPERTTNTALDTLFVVIGCLVALTFMVVPAAMARASEDRRLGAGHHDDEQDPATTA